MKYLTDYVPQGTGEMSDGYVVVEEAGVLKAQKLSFNGTTPTADGTAETLGTVGMFATGMNEPAYAGSGGGSAMKFYQCTAVDTESKTWSGKELVLTDGVYIVSETETTGLEYIYAMPKEGGVYNADCSLVLSSFYSGDIDLTVDIIDTAGWTSAQWQALSYKIQNGFLNTSHLGKTIRVYNNSTSDSVIAQGYIDFIIVDIDNIPLYNSTKEHSITLHSKDILFRSRWGTVSENVWDTSSIRSYLQSTFMSCLPQPLQDNIATVERLHWLYSNGGSLASFDTIFLPSLSQMGGGNNYDIQEGNAFAYYTENSLRIKTYNDNAEGYYLSSAGTNYDRVHRCEYDGGLGANDGCADVRGIAPALVIV